jgi:hypothetical protein
MAVVAAGEEATVATYQGFRTGLWVPFCHRKGPFSWRRPANDEQPGPPFSQITISLVGALFVVGKNQKKRLLCSSFSPLVGI